ncbi:MAG: hypothetical protein JW857_00920 [Bacteroidales bacterium]|nr:hypothetical protein [Bacteroidales bacterium]
MKKIKLILFFIALFGIFSACMKNELCTPVQVELKAGIYTLPDTEGNIEPKLTKMDLDSVYGLTMESQNLLFNAKQINEINFPLNDASNESSFVLKFKGLNDTIQDTIHFFYEKEMHFISVKCGVYYSYQISSIESTHHQLKSIILTNPKIDVVSVENILLVY